MVVAVSREPPLTRPQSVGPYRVADYERLPDEPRCELLFGRFYLSPAPSVLHQVLTPLLGRWLDDVATRSGGFALAAPVDVVLAPHSVVQPDLVYLTATSAARASQRIEGAPDLVIEILSQGTARRDRGEKLVLYAAAGVSEYWIVDAAERQIEFLVRHGDSFQVVVPPGPEYRSDRLPELSLDLEGLWSELDLRLERASHIGRAT